MVYTSQRIDFKVDEFYRIIDEKGYVVIWEKASICPCIPKDAQGQPDFNCPLCFGKGRYWHDPRTIKGIMTNFNQEQRFQLTGEILSGTSYFTTLPENKLGFWDRITHTHSQVRYSEVVEKGDKNAKDRLRFLPTDVIALRTVPTLYVKNKDYMVDDTGYVNWLPTGLEPLRGERYSVEYLMHPRWICIDLVNVLRDTYIKAKKPGITFQEMPVKALVRLEFFVV